LQHFFDCTSALFTPVAVEPLEFTLGGPYQQGDLQQRECLNFDTVWPYSWAING
jgi:hypothetical protein